MAQDDLDILARTLYGEAAPNNERDAIAIAHVVMNRVRYRNWPNTVAAVCLQPWQFSCWNANDPNRQRILNASGKWFERCREIAADAMSEESPDPTHTSTHYHTKAVAPFWSKGKMPVYDSGPHLFFNDIDTPPPQSAKEALDQERPLSKTRTARGATGVGVGGGVVALEGIIPIIDKGADQISAGSVVQIILGVVLIGLAVWIFRARQDDRDAGLR